MAKKKKKNEHAWLGPEEPTILVGIVVQFDTTGQIHPSFSPRLSHDALAEIAHVHSTSAVLLGMVRALESRLGTFEDVWMVSFCWVVLHPTSTERPYFREMPYFRQMTSFAFSAGDVAGLYQNDISAAIY